MAGETVVADIAKQVEERLSKGRFFAELFAPDATVWHNFDEIDHPVAFITQQAAYQAALIPDLHGEDMRTIVFDGGFIIQQVVRGTLPDGGTFEIPGAMVFNVADGKITRVAEYVTESAAAPLMQAAQAAAGQGLFDSGA